MINIILLFEKEVIEKKKEKIYTSKESSNNIVFVKKEISCNI